MQGQISLLCSGVLSFGLAHYASSEFELLAEELLMSDSVLKVTDAFSWELEYVMKYVNFCTNWCFIGSYFEVFSNAYLVAVKALCFERDLCFSYSFLSHFMRQYSPHLLSVVFQSLLCCYIVKLITRLHNRIPFLK